MPRVIAQNERGTIYFSVYTGLRNSSIDLIDLNESSLKSLKALPLLKIFKFLSRIFGHVEKADSF